MKQRQKYNKKWGEEKDVKLTDTLIQNDKNNRKEEKGINNGG